MDENPLGPVHAKVAPDVEVVAFSVMFSPVQTERLLRTENEGTGEPVMQAKPVLMRLPG